MSTNKRVSTCPKCGEEIFDWQMRCRNCGELLDKDAGQTVPDPNEELKRGALNLTPED